MGRIFRNCKLCSKTHTSNKAEKKCQREYKRAQNQEEIENELEEIEKEYEYNIMDDEEEEDSMKNFNFFTNEDTKKLSVEALRIEMKKLNNYVSKIESEYYSRRSAEEALLRQLKEKNSELHHTRSLSAFYEKEVNRYKSLFNPIENKTGMDLDSILCLIEPDSLDLILGIKCYLGSTRFRPHGDPELNEMCLLVNYPVQVFIKKDEKEAVEKEMIKRKIVFKPTPTNEFIVKKQIPFPTSKLIRILKIVNVSQVRIVSHDLKDPYFTDYFHKLKIIPHESNRFDFGCYEDCNYKLFKKEKFGEEIFPMFLLDNWEAESKERWGSLRSGTSKAYSTIIHHLKRSGNIAFTTHNISRNVLNRSLYELLDILKSEPESRMRYEISYFSKEHQKGKEIAKQGSLYLRKWVRDVSKRQHVEQITSGEWKKETIEILNILGKNKLIDFSLKSIDIMDKFYYSLVLNIMGYSFDPINRVIESNYEDLWPLENENSEKVRMDDIRELKGTKKNKSRKASENRKRKKIIQKAKKSREILRKNNETKRKLRKFSEIKSKEKR